MDSNPLYITGNTDTVYCMAMLDLETDGPTVAEIPPWSRSWAARMFVGSSSGPAAMAMNPTPNSARTTLFLSAAAVGIV